MRTLAVAAATAALVLPAGAAAAAWTNPLAISGTTATARSLAAPTLQCEEVTVGLTNGARVHWTVSTDPTTLSYTAEAVQSGSSLSVTSNSSVTLVPSLLATLFGTTVTIRVTGTLPGTSWTASSQRTVAVGLGGLYVNCS